MTTNLPRWSRSKRCCSRAYAASSRAHSRGGSLGPGNAYPCSSSASLSDWFIKRILPREADTSALVKHYHSETGTAEVDRLWNDAAQTLLASRLSALEIVSAFAGKVRANTISATDFEAL